MLSLKDQEKTTRSILPPTNADDADVPDAQQKEALLQTNARDSVGNYGALNPEGPANNNDDVSVADSQSVSEFGSERMSQMGESMHFHQHMSQHQAEQRSKTLSDIQDSITFYGFFTLCFVTASMLANGVGFALSVSQTQSAPVIATTGCGIGLNLWYIMLTILVTTKLLIQICRYCYTRLYSAESSIIHLGGNLILMPLLFFAFFMYTTTLESTAARNNIEMAQSMQIMDFEQIPENQCMSADSLSIALFATFQLFAVLQYPVLFYYIVQVVVVGQSMCLINAMVDRRLGIMRRRDALEEEGGNPDEADDPEAQIEQTESNLFMEGLFGGLLNVPLPIPEIIGSLDSETYKSKRKGLKDSSSSQSDSGGWKACPICWSNFRSKDMVTSLICNEKHIFHAYCIEEWIRKGNNSCPLCRQTIADL